VNGSTDIQGSPPTEKAGSTARVPELDALRGLAILVVLIDHFYVEMFAFPMTAANPVYWINRLLSFCWSGVDLFFVLSGFLIGGILLDNRESANFYRVFYLRRGCRILPLYYLFILPMVLVPLLGLDRLLPELTRPVMENPISPLWYFLFLQNFAMVWLANWGQAWTGITWSLTIEEQFYLLLPFIVRRVAPARLGPLLLVAIMCAPILRTALVFIAPSHAMMAGYILLPCRWDSLLLGVLGALLVRNPGFRPWLARHLDWLNAAVVSLLAALAVFALVRPEFGSTEMTEFGYTLFGVLYLLVLLLALESRTLWFRRLLLWRPLHWLGAISYGVYLLNQLVKLLLHRVVLHRQPQLANWQDAAVLVLSLVLTLLIAHLSWRYFEGPIVRFGHRFRYQRKPDAATASAAPISSIPSS